MELAVGTIVSGKVTTITKFGAFVALAGGKSGLVHISEVANTFVSDVHDFLEEGQEVQVKVLAMTPDGKINLSIKQTQPRPQQQGRPGGRPPYQNREGGSRPAQRGNNYHNNGGNYHSNGGNFHGSSEGGNRGGYRSPRPAPAHAAVPAPEPTFEDKLKQFMTMSDNKMSELNRNRNRDNRRRKKK